MKYDNEKISAPETIYLSAFYRQTVRAKLHLLGDRVKARHSGSTVKVK